MIIQPWVFHLSDTSGFGSYSISFASFHSIRLLTLQSKTVIFPICSLTVCYIDRFSKYTSCFFVFFFFKDKLFLMFLYILVIVSFSDIDIVLKTWKWQLSQIFKLEYVKLLKVIIFRAATHQKHTDVSQREHWMHSTGKISHVHEDNHIWIDKYLKSYLQVLLHLWLSKPCYVPNRCHYCYKLFNNMTVNRACSLGSKCL